MTVRHAILGLLAQRPAYGYELHAQFEALVGGRTMWEVKPAQVYTTLTRLEESGHVVHTEVRRVGGPDQRVYEITGTGREMLEAWYGSGVHPDHQRDEFFVKLMLAVADDTADAERVVRIQRASLYRDLHELTAHRAELAGDHDLAHAMLIDKAVMQVEAELRWLDMVEARLHTLEAQPLPRPQVRRRGRPPKVDVSVPDIDPPDISP